MAESRFPLTLPPGLLRNGTRAQAAGRWYDANLVRFVSDTVQPVGGWRVAPDDVGGVLAALEGTPRAAISWRGDGGGSFIAVGTIAPAHLYVIAGGVVHDITPEGLSDGDANTSEPTPPDPSTPTSVYGSGTYGSGTYGEGSSLGTRDNADTWQLDVFGDYLVAVPSMDGNLYVWEGDPDVPAAVSPDAPPLNRGCVVTPERYLILLGAGGNARRVQWPAQEGLSDWEATDINTAGGIEVATAGGFVCGRRTRKETLLWTDADVHTATYIGGEFIYRIEQQGDRCGTIAPGAVVTYDTSAAWMGREGFYVYDGYVKPLGCDVRDEVFGNLNRVQVQKIWGMTIAEHGEAWWFYPSGSATECDRYVVYNFREGHWSTGTLARTAGVDAGATQYPILLGPTGTVYEHESTDDRAGAVPFLESGPIPLGTGDTVLRVQKIYPDERTRGDVRAELITAMAKDGTETTHGPYVLADSTDVRLTARYVRLRLEEVRATDWRVGVMELGVVPAGRR